MPSKYGFTTNEDIKKKTDEENRKRDQEEIIRQREKQDADNKISESVKEKVSPFSSKFLPEIKGIIFDFLNTNSDKILIFKEEYVSGKLKRFREEFKVSEIIPNERYFQENISSDTHYNWKIYSRKYQ